MDPLFAFAIGFFGSAGAAVMARAGIDRVQTARAVRRRVDQSASQIATATNASTKPAAKMRTRIISQQPFVILRDAPQQGGATAAELSRRTA